MALAKHKTYMNRNRADRAEEFLTGVIQSAAENRKGTPVRLSRLHEALGELYLNRGRKEMHGGRPGRLAD